ncbi:MAG: phosphatase PAP2 family protein [Legionellaceae bacterium]|nr:phosphatase PAP2 family protein [Legionellaceae bacterium]
MNDSLAHFFLFFSSLPCAIVISLFGFVYINRPLFYQTACLGAFNLIINVALKGTFKIPLPPELHPGYAFPSGHMQFSVVFYGWLMLHLPSAVLRCLVLPILFGIGGSLLHFHYHNLSEVLAGAFFALSLILLYRVLLQYRAKNTPLFLISCSSLLMAYIALVYEQIPSHCWPAVSVLFSIVIIPALLSRRYPKWKKSLDRLQLPT